MSRTKRIMYVNKYVASDISKNLLWKKFENTRSTNFSYETLITPTKNRSYHEIFKTNRDVFLTRLIEIKFYVLKTNRVRRLSLI